jgi:hypothetical protein
MYQPFQRLTYVGALRKPLKRLTLGLHIITGLKAGVNDKTAQRL